MALPFAVVHPGTQHSWQVALALQRLDRLAFYATSIFYQPDRWPYRIERYLPADLGARLHGQFSRFAQPGLDPASVRTAGLAEWFERIALRIGARDIARRIDRFGNARFGARVASTLARADVGLWSFDNVSRELFAVAKARHLPCVLDRTIADWRFYNRTMRGVHQDYADFFLPGDYLVPDERIARNDEEFALADRILVGSEFAAATIRENAPSAVESKLKVVEYCYDEVLFGSRPPPRLRSDTEPLRFLFMGQAGPRKGIHLVLKAFQDLPRSAATVTIVGDLQVPPATFARYADHVEWRPTVPRAQVPALMASADVLLMPSYVEGSAVSLLEGLASGLGIIQSEAAGCGATERTGIRLASLDEEALREAVLTAVEDRDRVNAWRANAQIEAKKYSFSNYCGRVQDVLPDWP